MWLVLLSGGSGYRLWPQSNEVRSKQFLRVLPDGGEAPVSMVQRVWEQLGRVGLVSSAFVCSSKAQVEIIESQLGGGAPVIVEPERRDTFAAVALSALYLLDERGAAEDEIVAVLPVDLYVEDRFFEQVVTLGGLVHRTGADMGLLGVKPAEPSANFGYMRVKPVAGPDRGGPGQALRVLEFVEKPPVARAAALIAEGALWNSGVFCFRAGYIRQILRERGYPDTYEALRAGYGALPRRSFDYEVVERASSVVAMVYGGTWKDLGTWEALTEEMARPVVGVGAAVRCEGTHVVNELGIPALALGLKDAVVVATPDGILVADKRMAADLKEALQAIVRPGRPMYEERRWGSYRVLDYDRLGDGSEVLTRSIVLEPGKNISYHKHLLRTEIWTVVDGDGEMVSGTERRAIVAGDVVKVPPETWHAIRARTRLTFVEVQRGSSLVEEDILRRFLDWADIEAHCAGENGQ